LAEICKFLDIAPFNEEKVAQLLGEKKRKMAVTPLASEVDRWLHESLESNTGVGAEVHAMSATLGYTG